jgi:hypothetical protein
MATLHSIADGNFTSSSSWALVDTISFLDTRTVITTVTTVPSGIGGFSYASAPPTLQGVSIELAGRTLGTPTGTLTVELFNVTGATVVRSVTINVSDLPLSDGLAAMRIWWTYFQFSSPVTLSTGVTYTIRLSTSSASQVSAFASATTNWCRALVTTTNQAPAATDMMIIAGVRTGAGLGSTITLTMNNTAVVTFGRLVVGSLGVLNFGVAPSTNYLLTLAGSFVTAQSSVVTIGTALAPVPESSTVTVTIVSTTSTNSVVQNQLYISGDFTTYGATKTIATKLAADVAVAATTSTTTTQTGWKSGDIIGLPSTTRTFSQYETKALTANAVGTTLTHAALTFAHGGNATTRVQADVVNLTRNILITSSGSAIVNRCQVFLLGSGNVSFYYTQFRFLGVNDGQLLSGMCQFNNSNNFTTFVDIQYCSFTDATQGAATLACAYNQSFDPNRVFTISNNVFFGLGFTSTSVTTIVAPQFGDNNYIIGCLSTTQALTSNNMGSNNVVSSSNVVGANVFFAPGASGNSFYSNGTYGLLLTQTSTTLSVTNLTNFRIWRNNAWGIGLNQAPLGSVIHMSRDRIFSFDGLICFGNTNASINIITRAFIKLYFSNSFFYGGTTLVQPNHYTESATPVDGIFYNNCYFGWSDAGITISQFTGSILQYPLPNGSSVFSNCRFSGLEVNLQSFSVQPVTSQNVLNGNFISFNHNGVTGSNRAWYSAGVLSTDTTIFNISSKSLRITPNAGRSGITVQKLTSSIVRVPVISGNSCTISTKVRKSITSDGTVFNGTAPRLMYAFNPLAGNFVETIGAISTNQLAVPQTFSNSLWVKTNMTAVTSGTAPDGSATANLLTTTLASPLMYQDAYLSVSTVYTLSCYLKAGTSTRSSMNFTTVVGTSIAALDITWIGGVPSTNSSSGATNIVYELISSGWYRVSYDTTTTTTTQYRFFINPVAVGSGSTGTLSAWGAQINIGTTLLPYYDNGVWETLTYTTPVVLSDTVLEFYVDCDGTSGWINVDDWSTTTSNDSRGTDYWANSAPYIEAGWRKPGGSLTFVT